MTHKFLKDNIFVNIATYFIFENHLYSMMKAKFEDENLQHKILKFYVPWIFVHIRTVATTSYRGHKIVWLFLPLIRCI